MRRLFKFYNDEAGWFVDLPEWEGSKADLQMVSGADTFLDILSQGDTTVYVTLSDEDFDGADFMEFLYLGRLENWELGEGAWYRMGKYMGIRYDIDMWLCDVTKFVFGGFPATIYFKS
jgi:hypothetical protein